jgi:hypothetical protein
MGAAAIMARHRKVTVTWLVMSCVALALFSGLWGLWDWVA